MLPCLHLTFDISQEWNWKLVLDDGRSDRLLISPFTPIPAAHTEGAKKHLRNEKVDSSADNITPTPCPASKERTVSGQYLSLNTRTGRVKHHRCWREMRSTRHFLAKGTVTGIIRHAYIDQHRPPPWAKLCHAYSCRNARFFSLVRGKPPQREWQLAPLYKTTGPMLKMLCISTVWTAMGDT